MEPGLSYFSLETEHFSVHFPSPGSLTRERLQYLQKVAAIAEEVRLVLGENGVMVPKQKVNVVIADYFDFYNGYATPFPDNTIVLLPFPPVSEKTNYDNWLRTLFLHEFSHIVQMDACQGLPLFLRRVFGRVILPNALMPAFLSEGYAVYNETRFSNFGRLRSAEWHTNMFNAANANRLLTIDQCCSYELRRYPAGVAPYLYGGNFVQYCAEENGDSIWEVFNRCYSGQVPFFENSVARKIFGSDLFCLYQKWQEQLIRGADSIRETFKQIGGTDIKRITYDGEYISSPIWSRNGVEIYYISANGKAGGCIKVLNLGTMENRIIHKGEVFGGLSLSPDGRYLAFSEMRARGRGYKQGDIYFYDLISGCVRQITFNDRARDPDFSPDGASIVYVSNDEGLSRLILLNYQTGERTVVAEAGDFGYYQRPRFSPGGGLIAVGVWRAGGYLDIEVIDLKNGWLIPVTQDRASDLSPAWSKTGRLLFFVSDRGSVFNLYAYRVETKKLLRCSNVPNGVFDPVVSPDNRTIALVAMSEDGYDINLMDLRLKDWREAEEFVDNYPLREPEVIAVQSEVYQYSPFPSVLPKFWLPYVGTISLSFFTPEGNSKLYSGLNFGLFTLGWDVLRFHRYHMVASYRWKERTPLLDFIYELHRYQPVFQLSGEWTLTRQESRLGVDLPFYRSRYWQNLGFGTTFICDSSRRLLFDGSYRFSNAQVFRLCVAPVQGRSFGILSDAESKQTLSVRNRIRFLGYYNEYFGLTPRGWSLWARVGMGFATGDTSRLSAFKLSSQPGIFTVRGYADSGLVGANILSGGLQFRAPLLWVERGIGTAPLFLSNLNGALFWDAGLVGDEIRGGLKQWRTGAGGELSADFVIMHYLPIRFTLGVAVGIGKMVSHQIYFSLRSQLLESIMRQPDGTLELDVE
ncbi:MAG: hypothetical protein ACUVUR_02165 [bacterium]